MNFPHNIIKKIGKTNMDGYKYIVFIIFLLLISFLMNREINTCKKLTLLFAGLLICIYQPFLVFPFLVFLILIHTLVKKKISPQIETFYNEKFDSTFKNLLNKKLNMQEKNIIMEDYEDFINFIFNNNKFKVNQNDTEKEINLKLDSRNNTINILNFYKNYFDIYFIDINNTKDWDLINEILINYDKFDNFIDYQNLESKSFSKKLNDIYDNSELVLLKKLGIFFYQSDKNNKNIFNRIINILKSTGLYSIYLGFYEGKGVGNIKDYNNIDLYNEAVNREKKVQTNYQKIKKILFEIGIQHYKSICEDINKTNPNYFNQNEIIEFDFEPYHLYIKEYLDSDYFDKSESDFNLLDEFYVIRIPGKSNNKIDTLIDAESNLVEKEDINSKKIFKVPKYTKVDELKNKEFLNIEFTNISKELEDNFNDIKLLNQNYYKIEPNKLIAFNYLSLYYIFHSIDLKKHLKSISENQKDNLLNLYGEKSAQFKKQIEAEKLAGIYQLSSIDDLLIDNIFYYYQITNPKLNIKKIFPLDYHIEKIAPEETEDEEEDDNEISSDNDRQQLTYQKRLESDFDNKLLSNLREEQLEKYYSFLDKNKYEAINSLNKLAEAKNEKLRIENQSFSSVVDDFSHTIFEIINEISELVKNTMNNNLETFSNSPSPSYNISPSPSINENINYFQKFIIFIKKLSDILMNDKRAIHTGFVLIIIALFIYFIDNRESKYNSCCNQNSSSLLNFLKN
jgi:hypothetical protein